MRNSYDYELDLENKNSLSVILSKIKPKSHVLEFGCAHGRMSRYLKEVLECKVYGVEIDGEAAAASGVFMEQLLVENIESLGWLETFGEKSFDVIVFADVLEHLNNPLNVLRHAATLLGEDGVVYVSVPNITHNSVVMELFQEKFTYRDAGLLDSTHIRFFSYNSFKELVKESSLAVVFEEGIVVSPEFSEFEHRYEELAPVVGDFLEQREFGEVYQFVFGLQHNATQKELSPLSVVHTSERYAQLFVDCGEGYGEYFENIVVKNRGVEVCLEFDMRRYNNVVGLRFDPLNRCAVVALHAIVVHYESGKSVALERSASNALFSHDGWDYFTTYDPIYHFNLNEKEMAGAKMLQVVMSYQEEHCVDILAKIIDVKEKIINVKEEIINKLNSLWSVKLSLRLSRLLNFTINRSSKS